jgi:urease accessory protein
MIRVSVHSKASCEGVGPVGTTLTLPFALRQKSRLRAELDDGREVGLFLPRGGVLRGGDRLEADDGTVIEVRSAPERVSRVRAPDGRALARAAYHLGNRHVALEVGDGWLQYLHDHVLDEMIAGLGFAVELVSAPFEPERGAYGGGHAHSDDEHGAAHEHGAGDV